MIENFNVLCACVSGKQKILQEVKRTTIAITTTTKAGAAAV